MSKTIKNMSNNEEYNNISTNDIFKFMDLYFNRYFVLYTHLYNSMNKFFDEDIPQFLENGEHTFFEKITKNKVIKYKFKYENISLKEPTLDNDVEPMFPSDARNRNLTYLVRLVGRVTQVQEVIDIVTDEKIITVVGQPEDNVYIANLPVMTRSKYCSLSLYKGHDKSECTYDPGGHFIVNGSEKVIICQDRMVENKPLVFLRKDSGNEVFTAQVNSKSYKPHGITQIISIKLKKDGNIIIRVPILNEVNIFILFRALGVEPDRDVINYICPDETDHELVDKIRAGLSHSKTDKEFIKISTQEQAIEYLSAKLRVLKKYVEGDKNIKTNQKRIHILNLLQNNFLPHIEGSLINKAYFLGYMVSKLLKASIGRTPIDDRDSYRNKRVDLPGDLLMELFRQFYRQMLNNCGNFFKKRNSSDDMPLNIINQIKPNIIEQGIKASLLTGSWPRRKGVAQMMQRLTYLQTISFLRRIDAPSGDASTSKLTNPRHLHQTSSGLLCCLTGDSEILLSNGSLKLIKDITESDEILTVDYKNNYMLKPSKIHKIFMKENQPILKLTFENGKTIKCTYDHPFLVENHNNFNMKYSENMNIGDCVLYLPQNNEYKSNFMEKYYKLKVVNIEKINNNSNDSNNDSNIENIKVYDFETIEDTHTIIVNGIVTSNCVQTPEHAKVGLTKHLALIASITILEQSQLGLIRNFLKKRIIDLRDVNPVNINFMTKVFINGEWLGVSNNPIKLNKELRKSKEDGSFNPLISIIWDVPEKEIRIYCDGGRLYRPVLKVENNSIKLTKELLSKISLNKSDKSKGLITSWEEFLIEHPGIIEFIDMEEQSYLMICDMLPKLEEMRKKMVASVEKAKNIDTNETQNRYNDDFLYVKYSHCEFHPSFLIGEIASIIPFCNHNAGPRNIFLYAQAKQGMGLYASNYRDRLDISYILYHPQKSLISTRASRYNNTDTMASGENIVVAISTYTGFNQEDSIIFNLAAIDRGLFRSTSLKKEFSQIQKNQSSQDDIFMKPNPSKVTGMKHGSYDKLNDKGYVPEETNIVDGDIIIGKVSPIQPVGNSNKTFKDSSVVYKSYTPGVIDKVYTNIYNSEGYEMRKVRIRSERVPRIGDKFCCYSDDTEILTDLGWVLFNELNKNQNNYNVATLINGDTLQYTKPLEVMSYDFNDEMHLIDTNQVNLLVTPNHRMWVSVSNDDDKEEEKRDIYRIETAEEIYGKIRKFQKNVDYYIPNLINKPEELYEPELFKLKTVSGNYRLLQLDTWLTFFGILITEGCITTYKTILDKVISEMGFEDINDKDLVSYIESLNINSNNKSLPNWVWYLTKTQCRILIDSIMLGDEHIMNNGTRRYDTKSEQLADDLQRLCLHAGYSTNIIINSNKYSITIVESHNTPLINKNMKATGEDRQDSKIKYNGKVYCCRVNGDGVIYVRRNKIPVWCGNSKHGQKGTIGLYLNQSDMPFTKHGITPDIILNPHCFVGETLIALPNGLTKRINSFSKHGLEKVLTYNKDIYNEEDCIINKDNGIIESFALGMENKGFHNTIKIILADNREIICTLDHKFPIYNNNSTYAIKEAQDINNSDLLISGYHGTEDKIYRDELNFNLMGFDILYERNKVLAVTRLIGYYNKSNIINFETLIDMQDYLTDIRQINCTNNIEIDVLSIKLNNNLVDRFNKLYNKKDIPEFIKNCPKAVLREFIASRINIDTNILQKTINRELYRDLSIEEYMDEYGYRYSINNIIKARNSNGKLVNKYDIIIPTYNIKIKNILKHKPCEVFDIGVSYYRNFMANGIVTRNCIPSRMTVGQIIECIMGKSCAIKGVEGDGTPFNGVDLDSVREELSKLGYANSGKEYLYNGMTGQKLKTDIFIGPTYYLRLKHLVEDKFHARARGPKTMLMHQPPEGRSREGGLRVGEMERDTLLAHGISKFIKEKLMDTSDAYSTYICDICGLFAQRLFKKDNQSHSLANDLHYCAACKNYTKISKVMIPYAFKLVIQEMMAMNIAPRLRVEQDRII